MPELPEVEVVVRTLNKYVKNKIINKIDILYPKLFKTDMNIEIFKNQICGEKLENISRIAKHIIFEFSKEVLISHLRMEGKWFYCDNEVIVDNKHILAVMYFKDHTTLQYHDTRRFGTLHWQLKDSFKNLKPIISVGPEPFNESVNKEYLYKVMSKSSKHIKTILLDQTKISGIGNIYADEICFQAKIHPETKGKELEIDDYNKILIASKNILLKSISMGGTTIDSYQPEKGIDGKFQNELMVHTRAKKPCKICNTIIIKIKLNGRGTYFCPKCQNKL